MHRRKSISLGTLLATAGLLSFMSFFEGCVPTPPVRTGQAVSPLNSGRMPYPLQPDWSSNSTGCGIGLAVVDLNGDGSPDLVVSNGMDMCPTGAPLFVYYNDGDGGFPAVPWSSKVRESFYNLAVGDINGDGLPDVAVSVTPPLKNGVASSGWIDVFLNDGGTLPGTPDYTLQTDVLTLACALGDADGDGDLDLAVTALADSQENPVRQYIFYNRGGRLSTDKPWRSSDATPSFGVQFADVNRDGMLDLVVGGTIQEGDSQSRVYNGRMLSDGGVQIDADAGTVISTQNNVVMYLDTGPLGNAGTPSLVLSQNSSLGGHGAVSRLAAWPAMQTVPSWESADRIIGAGVVLADVNGDGLLDLLSASWREGHSPRPGKLRIYPGTPGGLAAQPSYASAANGIGETLVVADLRNRGLQTFTDEFRIQGPQPVVTLSHQSIAGQPQVTRNGQPVPPSEYALVPGRNWISFKSHLVAGDVIQVQYHSSSSLDLVLTTADTGTWIFYHR